MKKCSVFECHNKLDKNGHPIEYCDWQQGRCPMQKQKLDTIGYVVIGLMFTLLFGIIWLTI